MPRKSKQTWMPDPEWSDKEWTYVHFCQNNNIIISPMKKGEKYKVGIAINDYKKINYDKFEYEADQVWEKVAEYSKYYYDKYSEEKKGDSSL